MKLQTLIVVLCLIAVSVAAVWVVQFNGWTLYYGDAEAHLDIARRVVDSRTPGYDQLGTVWLPLPHALMLPLVGHDRLWRSGLAGAIPSAISFVMAGLFLYLSVRSVLGPAPAAASLGCLALNPNLLYLQATPMTEALLFAGLMAALYCTVSFAQTQSLGMAVGAGIAILAASLTRYEAWFLIPFVAVYFWLTARRRRFAVAAVFTLIAAAGPLYWLAHNWWYFGNPLEFYNGPYSPKAIQGGHTYPGDHDWAKAWLYFRSTAELCAGWGAVAVAALGMLAVLWKRAWWPLLFLALDPAFYVWSMHSSSGTPIFIPTLWPHTYYNSRYGLAALPLIAFCAGGLVLFAPRRARPIAALVVILVSLLPWLRNPRPDAWVCWKESQVNSEARRAWTHATAQYLGAQYRPGLGIFGTLGDLAGVFRDAGIPFREVLQDGNEPAWELAVTRPELFLHEEWAITIAGDRVDAAVKRVGKYRLAREIRAKDAPAIEIYKRN